MRAPIPSFAKVPLALAFVLAIAGCATRQADVTGSIPDDYRVRHPIGVTRGMASIDLLPGGGPGGLTDRQVADIQAFGADWRTRGRGRLSIQVPTGAGPVTDGQSAHAAKEIRRIFVAMGIPGQSFATERYPADGPGHLAPVRLEFPVLEAKLPHPCGQWPEDTGYGPGTFNDNTQYWNFGCAAQQNLAAQVEDPEDFIRPRAETSINASRRAVVLRKYRAGEATSTAYPKEAVDTQ